MKFRKSPNVSRSDRDQSDNAQRRMAHLIAAVTAFGSGVGVNLGVGWAMDKMGDITEEASPKQLGNQIESKSDSNNPVSDFSVDQSQEEQPLPDASAFKSRRSDDEASELRLSPGTTEFKR